MRDRTKLIHSTKGVLNLIELYKYEDDGPEVVINGWFSALDKLRDEFYEMKNSLPDDSGDSDDSGAGVVDKGPTPVPENFKSYKELFGESIKRLMDSFEEPGQFY